MDPEAPRHHAVHAVRGHEVPGRELTAIPRHDAHLVVLGPHLRHPGVLDQLRSRLPGEADQQVVELDAADQHHGGRRARRGPRRAPTDLPGRGGKRGAW